MPGFGVEEGGRLQVEGCGDSLRVGREERATGREVVAWVPGSRVDACASLSLSLRTLSPSIVWRLRDAKSA